MQLGSDLYFLELGMVGIELEGGYRPNDWETDRQSHLQRSFAPWMFIDWGILSVGTITSLI